MNFLLGVLTTIITIPVTVAITVVIIGTLWKLAEKLWRKI